MKMICMAVMLFITLLSAGAQKNIPASDIKVAMMKATRFMVEKVSNRGGYLWNYSPDFSRCWGELEAKPSMIWIEAGTPAMGNVFLNAYQLTGESYYLKAAQAAADALIWGQHSSGGWPYMLDFSGETSLKQWYSKVQKGYIHCAQEHAHYYGNCTYDDAATYDSGMFLLRMYLLTLDPKYKYPVERCLDFVLESQYPIGGWPQRYPLHYEYVKGDKEDYTSFITINDGVHTNNINFLLACYTLLGETRALEPLQESIRYNDAQMKQLGKSVKPGQILCPTFVEVGTNRPLYLHNDPDHYWVDYDYHGLITHYSSTRAIDLQSLKDEYQHLLSLSKGEVTKDSPFIGQTDISGTLLSHLMRGKMQQADTQKVDSLLTILKKKDYLPGRLPSVSKENPGFSNAPLPSEVISIKEYMNGMSTFIQYLTK